MLLYIDGREGSKQFATKFNQEEVVVTHLDYADIMFTGNGPDGDWVIGIEYKKLDDVVQCIKSGRFTGTQLPGMMRTYDICFLLVEGIPKADDQGQLISYKGRNVTYRMGLPYQAYDNFLSSVSLFSSLAGKPCIVKTVANERESVRVITDLYKLFEKKWDEHVSMSKPDQTKMQRVTYDLSVVQIQPVDPEYPQYVLRKALFQIDRVGWDVAGTLSEKFGTIEKALAVSQKEWQAIDGVGTVMADRIYRALHGYPDPTIKKRVKREKKSTDIDSAPDQLPT